jgi:hypothetical protein
MKGNHGFDEVMIVNPSQPGSNDYTGAGLMRFHAGPTPGMGYYAEPADTYGYYAEQPDAYGYYAETPDAYGHYAETPDAYGYYGQTPDAYGYYAQPADTYGYYAEPPDAYGNYADPTAGYGYYGQYPDPAMNGYGQAPGYEPMGYYGGDYSTQGYGELPEPYGYYAEDPYQVSEYEPVGYYGQAPEMVGYGQYDPTTAGYAGMGAWGQPEISGYVRQTRPAFNAGCPLPTNVNGVEEAPLEGYSRPAPVSPSCTQFTPQPGEPIALPDSFKPLW